MWFTLGLRDRRPGMRRFSFVKPEISLTKKNKLSESTWRVVRGNIGRLSLQNCLCRSHGARKVRREGIGEPYFLVDKVVSET